MGAPAKKRRGRPARPEASGGADRRQALRRVAMVAVSVLLAIGMMIPSAGLGMVSCTRCSVPIYD